MRQVNIYTYSTAKSPKAAESQCEAVGFVVEYQDDAGHADPKMKIIKEMTRYQSELYVLERALSRIETMCEVHVYTECTYVAAGFQKDWLERWKANGWKTAKKREVRNMEAWKALDAVVREKCAQITFHTKEDHPYREWLRKNMEKEKKRCLRNLKLGK